MMMLEQLPIPKEKHVQRTDKAEEFKGQSQSLNVGELLKLPPLPTSAQTKVWVYISDNSLFILNICRNINSQ